LITVPVDQSFESVVHDDITGKVTSEHDRVVGNELRIVRTNPSWNECKATGYSPATPAWLAVWLLIIADNIMHVLINGLALKYL
jgi:hypothetical protein